MPVADHPVHESTKREDNRPSCWNARKPTRPGYWAQDGWDHSGIEGFNGSNPLWVFIHHTMTTECQSDFPGCAGCKDFNQKEKKGAT